MGALLGLLVDAPAHGIAMFGARPLVIPPVHLPRIGVQDIQALLPGAATVAFVGLLEAVCIGRAFAIRREERFSANQEFIDQGLSNTIGGLFPGRKIKILALKGLDGIDLSRADLLSSEIRRAPANGGEFFIVAAHIGLVHYLKKLGVLYILGAENLHLTKTMAISAAVNTVSDQNCANCRRRVLIKCAAKPAPLGVEKRFGPRSLKMAIAFRAPPKGCIHHTDRGSQYCSHNYQKILRQNDFKVSMSGKGNCYDNATVETFFKTITLIECKHSTVV